MNEVSKIHLGRRPFTIAIDARQALKHYLEAISKQVDDPEVVEEIESRMAELLETRGINSDTVILNADVDFLISQLGTPKDFEDNEESKPSSSNGSQKRLFRDTDNAMIAGVASGLANYFGIDPLIVRLLFVVLIFVTVGWGILIYIVLWLLVPEAKTSSDRLQMAGKDINVTSLKEIVEKADIKGAAKRGGASISGVINQLFYLAMKVAGLALVLLGLSGILGLTTALIYYLARSSSWLKFNIFPIGIKENLLLYDGLIVGVFFAVFIIIIGMAIFRRKWPIRSWVTGVLVGLFLLGLAAGGALTADVYPAIRNSYNANNHVTTRDLTAFSSLTYSGYRDISFEPSTNYEVQLNYYGRVDLNTIKTMVKDGVLTIDTSHYRDLRDCQTICVPSSHSLAITVLSPNAQQLVNAYNTFPIKPIEPIVEPFPVNKP